MMHLVVQKADKHIYIVHAMVSWWVETEPEQNLKISRFLTFLKQQVWPVFPKSVAKFERNKTCFYGLCRLPPLHSVNIKG